MCNARIFFQKILKAWSSICIHVRARALKQMCRHTYTYLGVCT